MMEEKIKQIVSGYIRIPAEQIGPHTAVDNAAVQNSVMLHRMYAKLEAEGIHVGDYWDIRDFGTLLQKANGMANGMVQPLAAAAPVQTISDYTAADDFRIGIDIEVIASMPGAKDFREDPFYRQNFSAEEMAHCILQPNPYISFAGLFAAKEAIVKADNTYRSQPFHAIRITHQQGRPKHERFHLSISHTDQFAIAVAVQPAATAPAAGAAIKRGNNSGLFPVWITALLAFLVALVALIFAFRH